MSTSDLTLKIIVDHILYFVYTAALIHRLLLFYSILSLYIIVVKIRTTLIQP
jgi:hypothetical protein